MTTAAATVSLSGHQALQGRQVAEALRWWAAEVGITLYLADDKSSPARAADTYRTWLDQGVDLLLGPYGSGLVRRVGPIVASAGRILWNHGGSADDLARPLVVTLPAPASTYFHEMVRRVAQLGIERIVLMVGSGPFPRAVAGGAAAVAHGVGVAIREMPLTDNPPGSEDEAILVVATFDVEVGVVRRLVAAGVSVMGCVAAGLREFGDRLGSAAEGVLGPVQWLPDDTQPDVGPRGVDYSRRFRAAFGYAPDYVAAQAAGAGFLATEALLRRLTQDQIKDWTTTTLLGVFRLDDAWRQVGHRPHTIRWSHGEPIPID